LNAVCTWYNHLSMSAREAPIGRRRCDYYRGDLFHMWHPKAKPRGSARCTRRGASTERWCWGSMIYDTRTLTVVCNEICLPRRTLSFLFVSSRGAHREGRERRRKGMDVDAREPFVAKYSFFFRLTEKSTSEVGWLVNRWQTSLPVSCARKRIQRVERSGCLVRALQLSLRKCAPAGT